MATSPRKTTDATAPTAPSALALRIAQKSAPAWRPEPGETITWRLISAKMAEGGEYGAYPVLTVQILADDTFVNIHAFHTQLVSDIAKFAPAKGDVLTTHYVGYIEKNESKKRFALDSNESAREYYHNYVVFAGDGTDDEEDDSDVDFAALAPKVK